MKKVLLVIFLISILFVSSCSLLNRDNSDDSAENPSDENGKENQEGQENTEKDSEVTNSEEEDNSVDNEEVNDGENNNEADSDNSEESSESKEGNEEFDNNLEDENLEQDSQKEINETNELDLPIWATTELKNVNTGENYKIGDFYGKVILVESFAVWCPICTKQQKIIKDFHEEFPEVVSISLDTDPNEDEDIVKEHTEENGFDWYYSVSPIELTQTLISEFGVGIVNAPSVPMILICEDFSAKLLDRGTKSVEKLSEEIQSTCV